MTRLPIERIRNLGIIAHVDAGKTTLTERVLLFTGRIHAAGEVHDGTAHTDHHPIEQAKGITIMAAAVSCDWRDHRLHLIDTPGHADFTIEVERSLRVLDGAVVVLDAVSGVEAQTETVWRQADRHGVPRLVFVNKLDRPGADLARCLREVDARLGARAVAVTWPHVVDGVLVGVIDLVALEERRWDPGGGDQRRPATELSDNLMAARERLLDACADEDPAVLEALIEGREVTSATLWAALRRATLAGRVVPVACGAAYKDVGVQPLLDAVVALLPSPRDRGDVHGVDGGARPPDAAAPLAALAFKVVFDRHGQLTFVRVYSGVLARGAQVRLARGGRTVRVGRLVRMFADQREDVDRLEAGELGAILAVPITGGDTLSAPAQPIVLEAIATPEPVVRVAVEPVTGDDRERLPLALARMIAADPSLRLESEPETGQTLLAGMGQLHLEIAAERLATEHGVQVAIGRPAVAYRTTLAGATRLDVEHARQTGGPGQYARIVVELGPAPRGAGLVFEDRVRGGAVPRPYVAAVEAGVRDAMRGGVLDGYPVVDVHVAVVDGATHVKDSSELAFQLAGARALRDAAAAVGIVRLEPIMRLEVTCPEVEVGAVLGDLARRRGVVQAVDVRDRARVVRAEVPLAEMFGYAGALGALTHGAGRFVLEASRYAAVAAPPRSGLAA